MSSLNPRLNGRAESSSSPSFQGARPTQHECPRHARSASRQRFDCHRASRPTATRNQVPVRQDASASASARRQIARNPPSSDLNRRRRCPAHERLGAGEGVNTFCKDIPRRDGEIQLSPQSGPRNPRGGAPTSRGKTGNCRDVKPRGRIVEDGRGPGPRRALFTYTRLQS